jgi:D-glycero-D-manno-heptose 1,7-bisphosphate phosphatase
MTRAVFLDRDGVLNKSIVRGGRPYAPIKLEEFSIIEGAIEAVSALHQAGFLTIVVTNQPDVANGVVNKAFVDTIHKRLSDRMPLSDIKVCYHIKEDKCACRKPEPGMLLESAKKYDINLSKSYLVGDRWRDIDAARSAGCTSFFVNYEYSENLNILPDYTVLSLAEATQIILST